MSSSIIFKIDVRASFVRAFAIAALLTTACLPALAQHQGHDMPGMDMSKPKAKQTEQQK